MLGFSSTEITRAFSGGFKYKPTMSAALAVNSGSVLTHQLRCRAKHMPSFRNTRQTACTDVFKCFASAGPSHTACPFGGGSSSVDSTCLRNSSLYCGGLPDRGRSGSPAIPSASNRRRQSITVFGRTFKLSATALTGFPSRHPHTIRARSTNRASIVLLCAQFFKTSRSSSEHFGTGAVLGKGTSFAQPHYVVSLIYA